MEEGIGSLKRFYFWAGYLQIISIFFAALGALWAVIGSFDPFGLYDQAFAQAFWKTDELPADAKTAFRFILGPFGATSCGYFVLQFFIAKYAFLRRERWAYKAILSAFLIWLLLDTSMCLYYKAYFNIFFANIPSLIAMIPVFLLRTYFR